MVAVAAVAATATAPQAAEPAAAEYGRPFGMTSTEMAQCFFGGVIFATQLKCLAAQDANHKATADTLAFWGEDRDGGKNNAFKHAWWTVLIAFYTNDREFAWAVVKAHEYAYPQWLADKSSQMDLHNDRVGYHVAPSIMGGVDFVTYSAVRSAVFSGARNAIADKDGVNPDYTRLIYIC